MIEEPIIINDIIMRCERICGGPLISRKPCAHPRDLVSNPSLQVPDGDRL